MLKENEVKFYNQNGYLILKDKLDKETLSDLKNSTTQLIEEFKKNMSIPSELWDGPTVLPDPPQ